MQLVYLLSCQQNKIKQPVKTMREEKFAGKLGVIHIIPLGKVRKQLIEDVIDGLQSFYHQEIILENPVLLTEDLLAPSKTRYNANAILNKIKKDILILHPGPINRGVEITSDVVESNNSLILDLVENGVAIRMAIIYLLASKMNFSINE